MVGTATANPAGGASATTTATRDASTTQPNSNKRRNTEPSENAVKKRKKDNRKCCWNEPGGPWPRGIMLAASRKSDFADQFVTLLVGPDQASFALYHKMLGFHSEFFANAVKRAWQQADTRIIEMPEDKPEAVAEFIRWVSEHRLGDYGAGSDNPSLSPWDYWDLMTELWIFGHKYGIPRFQNTVVNSIFTLFIDHYAYPRSATVDRMYEETPTDCPLRKLLVDMVVLSHENLGALIEGQTSIGDGFHPDFIKDLLLRSFYQVRTSKEKEKHKTREEWAQVTRCLYHVPEVAAQWEGQKVLRPV